MTADPPMPSLCNEHVQLGIKRDWYEMFTSCIFLFDASLECQNCTFSIVSIEVHCELMRSQYFLLHNYENRSYNSNYLLHNDIFFLTITASYYQNTTSYFMITKLYSNIYLTIGTFHVIATLHHKYESLFRNYSQTCRNRHLCHNIHPVYNGHS